MSHAVAAGKLWGMGAKIRAAMMQDGVQPDSHLYTHLIRACGEAGDPDSAEQLFRDMEAQGIRPSLYAANALMRAYGQVCRCSLQQGGFAGLGWGARDTGGWHLSCTRNPTPAGPVYI